MANINLQALPYEVLLSIFDPLDVPSLVSLCLVSHICNEAATPVLYKSVSWHILKQEDSWDTEDPPWPAVKRLPWLRNHVQSLALCLDTHPPTQKYYDPKGVSRWQEHYGQILSRLTEEIHMLPSVQSLELVKRRWDHRDVFAIKLRWFDELVQSLGPRIQEITLPEIPFYANDCFKFLFHPPSLTVRAAVGNYLHSPYFKSWAPRLKRVSLPTSDRFSELGGLFTSLRCLQIGRCGEVNTFLDAIASSRELESLEMIVSESYLRNWANARTKKMDFPALKYIRVHIDGSYVDMRHAKGLFECITSTSTALLSISADGYVLQRKCTASESFAIWVSRRHGHTLRTLYLGRLPLQDDCIRQVLSRSPRLERIGFTQLWDQADLSQLFTTLRFALSLNVICLTLGKQYSAQQVYAALLQRFPHIRYLLLRSGDASATEYKLWEGKWRIDSTSGIVSRVVQQVECSERDWEEFISREQREFVDSLVL